MPNLPIEFDYDRINEILKVLTGTDKYDNLMD